MNILNPELQKYATQVIGEYNLISTERKQSLRVLSDYISLKVKESGDVKLNFICTHNSRRSHMTQLWAQAAAWYYNVPGISTFSGGTEATAFNPMAVAAMKAAGFVIIADSGKLNPVYQVWYSDKAPPLMAFSKVYDADPNPGSGFAAIMTCSHADVNCPVVRGAERRISLPFDDPKAFDGTPMESEKYRERCRQIAREMFYVFSRISI